MSIENNILLYTTPQGNINLAQLEKARTKTKEFN
jgi:hypothetical protein